MISDSKPHRTGTRARPIALAAFILTAIAVLAIALFLVSSRDASAVAPPVSQCNNETASNVGGQGVTCVVTVVNYVTSTGTLASSPPSTVTVLKCVGAAGPIQAGQGTCTTTTTTTLGEPITLVNQCNGESNGGGGVLVCTATITNYFLTDPATPLTPALIYQCIGSVITGTGAPGTCSPANTPGISSVGAATVGQCNGSGNGGTSVGFICAVSGASTTTTTLPVNINQCNNSANGGGSLVICTATVSNQVVPPEATAVPTLPAATPTNTPTTVPGTTPVVPSATPVVPSATPVVPSATPVNTVPVLTPTPQPTGEITVVPTGTPIRPFFATEVPPDEATETQTPRATQTQTPEATPTFDAPGLVVTPGAPSTGTGTTQAMSGSSLLFVWLGAAMMVLFGTIFTVRAIALKRIQ